MALPFLEGLDLGLDLGMDLGLDLGMEAERPSSAPTEDGDVVEPVRVIGVACGGAHTLVLCGTQSARSALCRSPKPASRRAKKVAVEARMCILDTTASSDCAGSSNSIDDGAVAGASAGSSPPRPGGRLRAVAGTPLNFKVIARSAAGVECSLSEGAHFGASLSGRRGAELPPPTIRHVRAGLYELSLC